MPLQPPGSFSWGRAASVDPAVVLGDALARHLTPLRLQLVVASLPGGSQLARRHPQALTDPGQTLQAVWSEGLAAPFCKRMECLSVEAAEALELAGWTVSPADPLHGLSDEVSAPALDPALRRLSASVRAQLAASEAGTVVVQGPSGSGCSAVAGLVAEDPRIHAAYPGGVLVGMMGPNDDLLDILRDWGAARNHWRLARAEDLSAAISQLRVMLSGQRALLVLDDVGDIQAVKAVWAGLGEPHQVLLTTHTPVPAGLAVHRISLSRLSSKTSERLLAAWAGAAASTRAGGTLLRTVAGRPSLVVRAGRLIGGSRPWLSPGQLLTAVTTASRDGTVSDLEEAIIDAGIRTAPAGFAETLYGMCVLPAAPASLPVDLLSTVLGAGRWEAHRIALADVGFLERVGPGRWRIPKVVLRVARRHAARIPQLMRESLRRARSWTRRRLVEAGLRWRDAGPLGTLARELRIDRRVLVALLGRDPAGLPDAERVPFALVSWLMSRESVQALASRGGELRMHPWHGATRRWLVAELLRNNRRQDASRLLSTIIQESRQAKDIAGQVDAAIQLARLHQERGRPAPARALLEDAVTLAEQARDRRREAEGCLALGELLDAASEDRAAVQVLWRSVALFRDGGEHARAAHATGRLGDLAQRAGQFDVAAERFRMQAALADAARDQDGVASAELRLGRLSLATGDPAGAVHWLERALASWDERGAGDGPKALGSLLGALAEASFATGEPEQGLVYGKRRVEEARQCGDRGEEGAAIGELACLLASTGARTEALALLSSALYRDRSIGDKRSEAHHLLSAGAAHGPRREPSRALVCFEAARLVAEEVGWRAGVAQALEGVATAEAALSQGALALRDARAALAIHRRLGEPVALARWQVLYGGLLIASGATQEGRQMMSGGANSLARLGWTPDQIAELVDGGASFSLGAGVNRLAHRA